MGFDPSSDGLPELLGYLEIPLETVTLGQSDAFFSCAVAAASSKIIISK